MLLFDKLIRSNVYRVLLTQKQPKADTVIPGKKLLWGSPLEKTLELLATATLHPPTVANDRPGICLYPRGDSLLADPSSPSRSTGEFDRTR
jgi:hypothetical protein